MRKVKICCMFMCISMVGLLAGCGNDTAQTNHFANRQSGVEDVLQAGVEENSDTDNIAVESETTIPDETPFVTETPSEEALEESEQNNTDGIDVDLSSLAGTMAYSEVYNMMCEPETYIGKTIKMDGLCNIYHDETTGKDCYACIIQDATACCAQGIEFQLTDGYAYPADYPKEEEEVTVIGVFDTYEEGEYLYCTLRDATLVK